MLRQIFKILLVSTFLLTSANALKKETLKNDMSLKIENVLVVLKNKNKKEKGNEIISIIDEVFDFKLMSRLALGKKTWKSISKEQRNSFIKLFEKRLKTSYVEKLELYTDQKVKILDLSPYKKSRLQLKTQLIGATETYEINYNFYKNKKKKEWFIYDVDLLGVSIIQTYKKQFSGLLKEQTFDELLKNLNIQSK